MAQGGRKAFELGAREGVFLFLSALFIATLALLNVLGLTRFLDLSFTVPLLGWRIPVPVAVGVLPYPVTFLCTDLISELYGRRYANALVWVGLGVNAWVAFLLWLGGALPAYGAAGEGALFMDVRALAFSAMLASMLAYFVAQLVDVEVFHLLKRLTGERQLWLRNNVSTLSSQWVDTTVVVLATHFFSGAIPLDAQQAVWPQLLTFIAAGYLFKLMAALADTVPFYFCVKWLRPIVNPADKGMRPSARRVRATSTRPCADVCQANLG